MEEIDAWFRDAGKRQRRVVGLYASLLRDRLLPYFIYRLRYLVALQTIGLVFHVAEFLILFASLQHFSVLLIFLLRAGALLLRGGWWGALEVMRERLRAFVGADSVSRGEAEISSWLVASLALAALVVAAALVLFFWSLTQLAPVGDAAMLRFYALLIVVELAVRIPIVTLHSGIYATRRVYRTLGSMMLPNLVQLAVLAALFSYDPITALVVAVIVATACSIVVTFLFTMRMYRVTGMAPRLALGVRRFGAFLAGLPGWRLALSALAGLALRIDALLVLLLIGTESIGGKSISLAAGHPHWNTPHIGIFLYLILPALRGAYEWSILFYFDLVRLRKAPPLFDIERRFFRKLLLAAVGVALGFWLMSVAVAFVVYRDISILFLVALVPLFVLRAWFALLQVRAFANERLALVCASVGVLLLGLAFVLLGDYADLDDLGQIMLCIVAGSLVLLVGQRFSARPRPDLLSLSDWCAQLAREPGPLQIGRLRLAAGERPRNPGVVADLLVKRLAGVGHCAWQGRSTLIYYCRRRDGAALVLDGPSLVEETGGLIARADVLGPARASGREACAALLAQGWFAADTEAAPDLDGLTRAFKADCPAGTVIDLNAVGRAAAVDGLAADVVASALPTALGALRSGSLFVHRGDANIFPLFLDEKLRMLFVVPAAAGPPQSLPWVERLRAWQASALKAQGTH